MSRQEETFPCIIAARIVDSYHGVLVKECDEQELINQFLQDPKPIIMQTLFSASGFTSIADMVQGKPDPDLAIASVTVDATVEVAESMREGAWNVGHPVSAVCIIKPIPQETREEAFRIRAEHPDDETESDYWDYLLDTEFTAFAENLSVGCIMRPSSQTLSKNR